MASNCKVIRAEIEERGGAGAWLSRAAAEHLEACAGCLGFMNERESLRRLVGGLGRVEAPADFEFRLRARMAAAKEKRGARFAAFRLAPGLAALAAAVLVASTAAAYYFNRTAPTADQTTSHQTTVQPQQAAQTSSPASTDTTGATTKDAGDAVGGGDGRAVAPSPSNVERAAAVVGPPRRERRRPAARVATEPRAEAAKAQPAGTLEFGLSTSPVVTGSNVKLEVPAGPLRVVVRDERGTARRLPMRTVSFGAQNPVGKRRETTTTTVADGGGVW